MRIRSVPRRLRISRTSREPTYDWGGSDGAFVAARMVPMANSHPGPGTTETDLAHDRGSFRALVAKPGRSKGPGARGSLDGVVAGNCPSTLRQCRPPALLYVLLPRGTISSAGDRRFDQVVPGKNR